MYFIRPKYFKSIIQGFFVQSSAVNRVNLPQYGNIKIQKLQVPVLLCKNTKSSMT